MAAIFWEEENFWKIANSTLIRYLVGRKFNKTALSCMVKEIEANLCFSIFGKTSKIQNGCHMWEEEIFFLIAKGTLLRYPVGRKF